MVEQSNGQVITGENTATLLSVYDAMFARASSTEGNISVSIILGNHISPVSAGSTDHLLKVSTLWLFRDGIETSVDGGLTECNQLDCFPNRMSR